MVGLIIMYGGFMRQQTPKSLFNDDPAFFTWLLSHKRRSTK